MEEESKNLLPTVDVPDFVDEEEDEEYDVDYKPSPMWILKKEISFAPPQIMCQ